MHRLNDHIASFLVILCLPLVFVLQTQASADQFTDNSYYLAFPDIQLKTESKFSETAEEQNEPINYSVKYVDDPELEIGQEKLLREGKEGEKRIVTNKIFYSGKEYSRSVEEEIIRPAVDKLIAKGTKVVHRQLETDQGTITYYQKLSDVWATSYDSTCPGCSTTTATGRKQGYGVVAVDPNLIRLNSKLYIPGYGIAVAGDVGGSIKGKRIDLGYDSLNGQWKAHYVDVYLLVD